MLKETYPFVLPKFNPKPEIFLKVEKINFFGLELIIYLHIIKVIYIISKFNFAKINQMF